MMNLYQLTVSLFYQLANAFFWPVAVVLVTLLTITLIDLDVLHVLPRRPERFRPRPCANCCAASD